MKWLTVSETENLRQQVFCFARFVRMLQYGKIVEMIKYVVKNAEK